MRRAVLGLVVVLGFLAVPTAAYAADPVLSLSAPASVEPAGQITVTGTLVDGDGLPLKHVDVNTGAVCLDPQELIGTWTTTTDNSGGFSFGLTAGACSSYRLDARYVNPTGADGYDSVDVAVNRTPTSLAVTAPDAAFTQSDVPVSLKLTADGAPLASASVTLARVDAGTTQKTWVLTTDADGVAATTDSISDVGTYTYDAEFDGTVTENLAHGWSAPLTVARRPVALTLTGPSTAALDEPFSVSGSIGGPELQLPAQVTLTGPTGLSQTVTTDANGQYDASLTPTVGGLTRWSADFAGDALHASAHAWIDVDVPKITTSFDLTAPTTVHAGDTITVTGRLLGVDEPTTIYRSLDPWPPGPELLTNADGTFQLAQETSYPGTAHFDFRYPGDARHDTTTTSWTVTVLPDPVTMSLTVRTDPGDPWGRQAQICYSTSGPHLPVVVRGTDRVGHVYLVTGGLAQDSACLIRQFPRAVRITAVAPVDDTHAGAMAAANFKPGSYIYSVPTRARRFDYPYSVYEHGAQPLIVSWLDAPQPGSCVHHQVQRRMAHRWRTVGRTTCEAQDSLGRSRWRMVGSHPAGARFRVRAIFAGSIDVYGTRGRWRYIRFV